MVMRLVIKKIKTFILPATFAGLAMMLSCGDDNPATNSIPDAPSDLTGEAVGTFSVQLYWSDNSDNEDNFVIYRSVGGPYELAGTAGANSRGYLDEIPVSCVEASYYVVAGNNNGQSSFSNLITVPLLCIDFPGDLMETAH